ncbi:MAG: 16S rRNA (cytidine(1402)-2'-O)-methyltransferase [Bacteroidales bacterium]|nr:16S rRNA (cytidine(1402)-2'-O)-methyltransferase [Bacteroidales bacterium]
MKLFLVPTPVGNLEDFTFRAVRTLKEVSLILCEDTRTSLPLLNHYDIHTPLQSHHLFNEHETVSSVISRLKSGENIALITDAGTPAISDPGFLLVRECVKENIDVECLPGATAFVPALVDSGFSCERFCFEGFLPHKKGRQSRLNELKEEKRTIIFYESPFRVGKLLSELQETFGDERKVCVCREISKKFEQHLHGTLKDMAMQYKDKEFKGEIVVILSAADKTEKLIKETTNKYKSIE